MPSNITMPALSPTMEEGNLTKWLVKEGDKVKSGDVIAEIETDKATMEVEAVDEGTIAKILIAGGTEGVKVNTVIAVLAAEGEDVSAAASGSAPSALKAEAAPTTTQPAAASPSAPASAPQAAPAQAVAPAQTGGERVFASPLARRIAKDAGLDVGAIAGSGPHARVIKADVEKAVSMGGARPLAASAATSAPAVAPKPAGAGTEAILKNFEPGSYELVPHDGMRKTIAKRLQESKQTIPHFYVSVDCELDALLALRTHINDASPAIDGKPAYKLSVNDMIIKALALSLRDVPDANVSWTDTDMIRHKHADVGVAVSIPGGLITPIIRSAELKSLSTISAEMKDLAKRAKERKLKPEEYQGGTTAVSNMGMMGVKSFSAVINPPHATILAVGAGESRVVVKSGEMVIAQVMTVTLSTDHRCVDGALGATLLGVFRRYIESPMAMLV